MMTRHQQLLRQRATPHVARYHHALRPRGRTRDAELLARRHVHQPRPATLVGLNDGHPPVGAAYLSRGLWTPPWSAFMASALWLMALALLVIFVYVYARLQPTP